MIGVAVAAGRGVFVAAGIGVFVAAGIGVSVAAGIGVSVAAGMGVSVATGTGVSVAAGGKVGVSIGLWKAAEDDEDPAETGNTAITHNTSKATIRITRGAVFMRLQPPSTDFRGGGSTAAASTNHAWLWNAQR
jgi:hypothetical protein